MKKVIIILLSVFLTQYCLAQDYDPNERLFDDYYKNVYIKSAERKMDTLYIHLGCKVGNHVSVVINRDNFFIFETYKRDVFRKVSLYKLVITESGLFNNGKHIVYEKKFQNQGRNRSGQKRSNSNIY